MRSHRQTTLVFLVRGIVMVGVDDIVIEVGLDDAVVELERQVQHVVLLVDFVHGGGHGCLVADAEQATGPFVQRKSLAQRTSWMNPLSSFCCFLSLRLSRYTNTYVPMVSSTYAGVEE